MPTGSVSCRIVASPRVSLRGWSLTKVTLRQLLFPSHSWTVVSAVAAMVTCSCCDWNSIQARASPGAGHQAVSLKPSKAEVSDFDASGPPNAPASAADEDARAKPSIVTAVRVPADG